MKYYILVNKLDGHKLPCVFLTYEKAKAHAEEMQEEYWDIVEQIYTEDL